MVKLRVAVVCSSNMNRSMKAHYFMRKGFNVKSFGTGTEIRLPGSLEREILTYKFGTSYKEIYDDLAQRDPNYYHQNGVLEMLKLNDRIKSHPQQFHTTTEEFDLIITCDSMVYNNVCECLTMCKSNNMMDKPVFIVNFDISDNFKDAMIGAFWINDLTLELQNSENLDVEFTTIVEAFGKKISKCLKTCKLYY